MELRRTIKEVATGRTDSLGCLAAGHIAVVFSASGRSAREGDAVDQMVREVYDIVADALMPQRGDWVQLGHPRRRRISPVTFTVFSWAYGTQRARHSADMVTPFAGLVSQFESVLEQIVKM